MKKKNLADNVITVRFKFELKGALASERFRFDLSSFFFLSLSLSRFQRRSKDSKEANEENKTPLLQNRIGDDRKRKRERQGRVRVTQGLFGFPWKIFRFLFFHLLSFFLSFSFFYQICLTNPFSKIPKSGREAKYCFLLLILLKSVVKERNFFIFREREILDNRERNRPNFF